MKNAETKFLGYEFSSNKNKSGIKEIKQSVLNDLISITNEFICNGSVMPKKLNPQYSKIVALSDITINVSSGYSGDIYPKRQKVSGTPLNNYCKINNRNINDFVNVPTQYLEISNLGNQKPTKNKTTNRFCKKGDILVSSVLPKKTKIVVATGDFMLTTAIHVLSDFKNIKERDFVFQRLQDTSVIEQMCALLDGFKVTYAKISEDNLYNNILI